MTTKTCAKCGETKPLDDYHRDRSMKDGRMYRCKKCNIAHASAYRSANLEKVKKRKRAHYVANRDKVLAQQRAYQEANREKIKEQKLARYEANRDEMRAKANAYRAENQEKMNAQARARYAANRDKKNAQARAYRERNREEMKARSRAYYEENREKLRERKRAYCEENREELNARHLAYRRKLNAETRAVATRNGEPWTAEEDHYLATTSDNNTEAAFNLGRTYKATSTRRTMLRRAAA